jgi:hypothetical protein
MRFLIILFDMLKIFQKLLKSPFVLLCKESVCLCAGEVIGALCKKNGSLVYADIRPVLLNGIKAHIENLGVQSSAQVIRQLSFGVNFFLMI